MCAIPVKEPNGDLYEHKQSLCMAMQSGQVKNRMEVSGRKHSVPNMLHITNLIPLFEHSASKQNKKSDAAMPAACQPT